MTKRSEVLSVLCAAVGAERGKKYVSNADLGRALFATSEQAVVTGYGEMTITIQVSVHSLFDTSAAISVGEAIDDELDAIVSAIITQPAIYEVGKTVRYIGASVEYPSAGSAVAGLVAQFEVTYTP